MFGKTDKKVCQCLDVPTFIKKLVIPLLLDILLSKRLNISPPLTSIGGIHLDYFVMIVMLFSFADFALDLISPKFIVRGVFVASNKSLQIQILSFFVIHGLSFGCFLITLRGRNVSIAEFRSFRKPASLSSAVVADKTMLQSFSVIHHPSARHALSRISRDSILLITDLCFSQLIGFAKMV